VINRPNVLENQLKALQMVGFEVVDCYYKNGIVVVLSEKKQ
jgi:hypothetical protein